VGLFWTSANTLVDLSMDKVVSEVRPGIDGPILCFCSASFADTTGQHRPDPKGFR
jgi:hypothetical protein